MNTIFCCLQCFGDNTLKVLSVNPIRHMRENGKYFFADFQFICTIILYLIARHPEEKLNNML